MRKSTSSPLSPQAAKKKRTTITELDIYANSELCRKEASGMLATKFSISVEDVNTIESFLYPDPERSRRGPKDTSWNAMLRIVALKNSGSSLPLGVQTIEAIYRKGQNAYLEEKKT